MKNNQIHLYLIDSCTSLYWDGKAFRKGIYDLSSAKVSKQFAEARSKSIDMFGKHDFILEGIGTSDFYSNWP